METNPWKDLEMTGKYIIAKDDNPDILNLAERLSKKGKFKLNLNLLPEPFVGDKDAPIYLLNLNPGYDDGNEADVKKIKDYVLENNKLYCDKHSEYYKYPFYWLNPKLANTSGAKYWKYGISKKTERKGKPVLQTISPRLGKLLERIGNDELVSKKIFCIEYFPYHSENYNINETVPSQQYSRNLIKQAIDKTLNKATPENEKKIFIIMRKAKEILGLFREELNKLQKEGRVFICSSPANPCISVKNIVCKKNEDANAYCEKRFGKNGWERIIEKIIE